MHWLEWLCLFILNILALSNLAKAHKAPILILAASQTRQLTTIAPLVDVLFNSVAALTKAHAVSVILTVWVKMAQPE